MLAEYPPARCPLLYVVDDLASRRLFERATKDADVQFDLRIVRGNNKAIDYLTGSGGYDDRHRFPLPDVILLDFSVRAGSAVDLLVWMRKTEMLLDTEVAIFTAADSRQKIAKAYAAGADYYLVKPMDYSRLVELVRVIDCGLHSISKQRLFRAVTLPEFRPSVHDGAVEFNGHHCATANSEETS